MVDEETPLVRGGRGTSCNLNRNARSYEINVEWFRFFGLISIVPLLLMGKFMTEYFVVFPAKENPSSPFDKIFRGAPTDFDYTATYIFKLFNFNHTCSVLDFNPSKTVAALIIMVHEIPLLMFVIFNYWRIQGMISPCFDKLKIFNKIASPFQFLFILYFYLVFVNSPDGDFNTQEGWTLFTLHYIPFMFWQLALLLMAIQQSWYYVVSDTAPATWLTPKVLWYYVVGLVLLFIVYTTFIWTFILDQPLWDTTKNPGKLIAIILMWVWNFAAIFFPAYFAYNLAQDHGACSKLVFDDLNKFD